MAKLPWPPATLSGIDPDVVVVPRGTMLWRVYLAGGPHPVAWNAFRTYGPLATARFDHHEPPVHDQPDRGILYAADSAPAAIVEAFQETRLIDRTDRDPWLVAFRLHADLVALDLVGPWPTRAGASQTIATGRRDVARAWSRATWDSYPTVLALRYRSSMAGGPAINLAIYERAARMLPPHPALNIPLSHPGLAPDLNRIAPQYGFDLR
jgi:hypothetical protein